MDTAAHRFSSVLIARPLRRRRGVRVVLDGLAGSARQARAALDQLVMDEVQLGAVAQCRARGRADRAGMGRALRRESPSAGIVLRAGQHTKRTHACERSGDTRREVSVTRPRRGSRTSRRISSARQHGALHLLARFAWRVGMPCWTCRRGMGRFTVMPRSRDLDAGEALDLVADAHIVVVLHADAALGARTHFVDVVLEAAQRLELALEDHDVVAQHADRVVALDRNLPLDDQAAGHRAELARAEHLAHLRECRRSAP